MHSLRKSLDLDPSDMRLQGRVAIPIIDLSEKSAYDLVSTLLPVPRNDSVQGKSRKEGYPHAI